MFTSFRNIPLWQRAVIYTALGLAVGWGGIKKLPPSVLNTSLVLVAVVGPGVAYQMGINYSMNQNQQYNHDTNK